MKQKNMILMVVAVGCGLVAAFLTSQMSGKSAPPEQVDVIVAAKDIPVGTQLTKEELEKSITRTKMAKDVVPAGVVETDEDMLDQRTTRGFTKGEVIKKGELTKFAVVNIPEGKQMMSLPLSVAQAAAGFVAPGTRVDIVGTMQRRGNRREAIMILSDVLVLAVDGSIQPPKEGGAYPTVNTVSFALIKKEADLLSLAVDRGCQMRLVLRRANDTGPAKSYSMDKVFEILQNPEGDELGGTNSGDASRQQAEPEKAESVKVPVASSDIAEGQALNMDLFKMVDLPKRLVTQGVVTDPAKVAGKWLKQPVAKGQWLTEGMLLDAEPKTVPQDTPKADSPKPADPPAPLVKRKTHDFLMHTPNGSRVYRYEEVRPGQWRLIGEFEHGRETAAPADDEPKAAPSKRPTD